MTTDPWQPTLDGALLHLRPLAQADFEALYAAANDPDLWAAHPFPDRWRAPEFRKFFVEIMATGGAMAIVDRLSGALIGSSTFHSYKPKSAQVEIGKTFLRRSHWGGVFNSELKRLMLTQAFRHVDRVVFRIADTNVRSRRACEKIGGRLTERIEFIDGPKGPIPFLVYQIDKSDFQTQWAETSPTAP